MLFIPKRLNDQDARDENVCVCVCVFNTAVYLISKLFAHINRIMHKSVTGVILDDLLLGPFGSGLSHFVFLAHQFESE